MTSRRFHFDRRRFLRTGATATTGLWALGAGVPLLGQDIRNAGRSATVATRHGRVQGLRFHGNIDVFYGIPYAASTAGANRFQAPRDPDSWSEVREATQVGKRSPQTAGGPITEVASLDRRETMGEDCLVLNVFTPGTDNANRPVMFWLHGGGFTSGSGGWLLYDGTNLARKEDVVVVTVNHRLNVFGHLSLAELGGDQYADSGNAGILDVVKALEWVRDNIEAFGGNPDKVTLFGQSGGAGKVSTLMAMPGAQGLFHRAIAMSGSNIEGITPDQGTDVAERYLRALEVSPNQLDRLQDMPMRVVRDTYLATPGLQLGPIVDGKHLPRSPFAPDAPPISKDIPMMLSSTEHEVNFFPGGPLEDIDDNTLTGMVFQALGTNNAHAQRVIGAYSNGRPQASNIELYQIIASDSNFGRRVLTQAERKADQNGAPVYMYYFRWNSAVRDGALRAYHCLDIPFAFNNIDEGAAMTGAGQDRYPLADQMSAAFAEFARTGKPAAPNLPDWPAFDTTTRATMVMDSECEVMNDPFGEARRVLYGMS